METSVHPFLEKNKQNVSETLKAFRDKELAADSFCIMPFVNIILEPDGNIGICRHKGHDFTFGNIRDKSIDEIWESEAIQAWRKEHLTGNTKVCSTELTDRQCNLCPELNKLLPHAEITNTKNPKILRLTANLNGQCNLQCQMCSIWQLPNGFYTEENFWIPAREKFFKDILEVDLLSGEPFIQKDTFKLIDEISSVNPDCSWSFTTNLHWKLSDKLVDYLNKIKIKHLLISIDSLIPETYHKIRYPGDLNFVLKNLDDLLLYQVTRIQKGLGSLNLRINFLVQKDNWREVKHYLHFCLSKEITPFITFLYGPVEFSLLNLSHFEKLEILDFYFETLSYNELLFTQRVIKPLLRSLPKIDYIHYLEQFHQLTRQGKVD